MIVSEFDVERLVAWNEGKPIRDRRFVGVEGESVREECRLCGGELKWKTCSNECNDGWKGEFDDRLCDFCSGQGGYLVCPNAKTHIFEKGIA